MSIRKLLEKYVNEICLVDKILSFVGKNECEKCGVIQEKPLTVVISWNKGDYNLKDIRGSDYKLKKVCETCTVCRCSQIKIYREIEDEDLIF